MKNLVFNIQKFSIHDGSGIRSTIFMKGCSLNCAWCHNPEGISFEKQLLFNKERCINCMFCIRKCKFSAIFRGTTRVHINFENCTACGECAKLCPTEALELCGTSYSAQELVKKIAEDEIFYDNSGGGVTFSGGEVMAQDIDFLLEVIKKLHQRGYSVNIDTSGYTRWEKLLAVAPYIDTFLYDLKIADNNKHKAFTGQENHIILTNLNKLDGINAKINIRIPVIGGFNANNADMQQLLDIAKSIKNITNVNLLPYHTIGTEKADKFGFQYNENIFTTPNNEFLRSWQSKWKQAGFSNVKIGG